MTLCFPLLFVTGPLPIPLKGSPQPKFESVHSSFQLLLAPPKPCSAGCQTLQRTVENGFFLHCAPVQIPKDSKCANLGFREVSIQQHMPFFFLKQMVLVTVEESTWGMTRAFGLIYSCVLGCFFFSQSLSCNAINEYFSLSWHPGCRTGFSGFVSKDRNARTFL